MKVSIITICKNEINTIENVINTVSSQLYSDIEHIIIDGVSTDGTIEIVKQAQNSCSHKIILLSEEDSGVYNAMNKGVKIASGDILYFLNANDYLYDENVIGDIVQKFKSTKAAFIYGALAVINEEKELIDNYSADDVDKKFFMDGYNICHQSIFYKKILFDTYGLYDESYKIMADYDFNLKMLIKNKVPYSTINRPIAKFTLGGLSTSDKYKEIFLKERAVVQNKYFNQITLKINTRLNKLFRKSFKNNKFRKLICCLFGFNITKAVSQII